MITSRPVSYTHLDVYKRQHRHSYYPYTDRIPAKHSYRVYTITPVTVSYTHLADKYGVGVHMHIAEAKAEVDYAKETRGATTVTHLNNLGFLDKNIIAAHAVWLSNEEVEMFRDHDVTVSHNPASAMRVLGFAKIPRMLREGVCVALGTDGTPTNNRMNMVDEMWVTSLIHKG